MVASVLQRDAVKLIKTVLAGTATGHFTDVIEAAFGEEEPAELQRVLDEAADEEEEEEEEMEQGVSASTSTSKGGKCKSSTTPPPPANASPHIPPEEDFVIWMMLRFIFPLLLTKEPIYTLE